MNLDTKFKMRLKLIIHWSEDESMNEVKLYLHKKIYTMRQRTLFHVKKVGNKKDWSRKITKHVKLRVWELVANGKLIIFTLYTLPAASKFLTTADSQPDDEISHRKLQNYRRQWIYAEWMESSSWRDFSALHKWVHLSSSFMTLWPLNSCGGSDDDCWVKIHSCLKQSN